MKICLIFFQVQAIHTQLHKPNVKEEVAGFLSSLPSAYFLVVCAGGLLKTDKQATLHSVNYMLKRALKDYNKLIVSNFLRKIVHALQ